MHPQTTEQQYRIAFDVMAGIEPFTVPASATPTEITDRLQRKFITAGAIDDGHEFAVAVDVEAGTVVVRADGDVIEHGSITLVPDYWLNLANDLRQAADRVATLRGTAVYPGHVNLAVLVSVSDRQADLTVPLVDKLAAAFDITGAVDAKREQYRAEGTVGHLRVTAYTFIPKPEDPEKAALAARIAELEAQIAGGAR